MNQMLKSFLSTATILLLSGVVSVSAQTTKSSNGPRFLDDISVEVAPMQTNAEPAVSKKDVSFASKKESTASYAAFAGIESAEKLQFKYSLLLDTEVEMLTNLNLFRLIEDWFGTRYKLGGNSKMGIDCSALMQVMFASLYGIAIPRTSKEQYGLATKIDRSELKEGDLVFFNTTGGVSHVGFYLLNNKFVHASTSGGVTISDLDEDYWGRRLISFGRIEEVATASSPKP
jgi:cell wall-associated NlpC family hydrolase